MRAACPRTPRRQAPCSSHTSTAKSRTASSASSTRRSTPMSTIGRRPRSSPRTRSSKNWAGSRFSACASPKPMAARGWTTRTAWRWPRPWAISTAAVCRWPLACRPTCAPRRGGVPPDAAVHPHRCPPATPRHGSEELKQQFLAPAIAGDMVGCIGVSEPDAGSDVAGIRSVARKDGADYLISGQKMWITNSLQADWMCMLVNTDSGSAHKNKSLVIVPLRAGPGGKLTPGVQIAQKIRKIGMHSSDTGLLHFDEVRVPQRYRIGAEGQGFVYQMQQFQQERLWCAASTLETLTHCIDWTIEWARQRQLFGGALADQQWVQFKLAELKTEVEALRALTYRACDLYVAGQDVLELASMAKLKAGRLNRTVPDTCLQFWGGMGYTLENKVARMYRDGRLASIGGGADEVMLGIIAKTMGIAKRPGH